MKNITSELSNLDTNRSVQPQNSVPAQVNSARKPPMFVKTLS